MRLRNIFIRIPKRFWYPKTDKQKEEFEEGLKDYVAEMEEKISNPIVDTRTICKPGNSKRKLRKQKNY